jgi:hypothetical protein
MEPVLMPSTVHRSNNPSGRPGRSRLQLLMLPCSSAVQLPIRAHSAPALLAKFPSRLYEIASPIALQLMTSPGM